MSSRAKQPLVIATSTLRVAEYWRTKRDRARRGIFVGTCDCGQLGRQFVGGDVVCDRCRELDRAFHGSEMSRGVVGYTGYGILARKGVQA
jgi:hypothetical protein